MIWKNTTLQIAGMSLEDTLVHAYMLYVSRSALMLAPSHRAQVLFYSRSATPDKE